jgi:uncharacterized protein (TIGR03790 family)
VEESNELMNNRMAFCIAEGWLACRNAGCALTAALIVSSCGLGLGLPAQGQTLSPAVQQAVLQAAETSNAASNATSGATSVGPSAAAPVSAASAASAVAARKPAWISVPRLTGRLQAADIGVVINVDDPLSVQIGQYYISARRLKPKQVLRVNLPLRAALTPDEFEGLRLAIDERFGSSTQALALAWSMPYMVACNAITGALALGLDAELCSRSCAPSRPSRYFNSPSNKPLRDHGFRPSMLLAARNFKDAKALIDRGVASDATLGLRGRPPVTALMLATDDGNRRVRMPLYPPPTLLREFGVDIQHLPEAALQTAPQIFLAITGSIKPKLQPAPDWVPGGLGDHLTSVGGDLFGAHDQGTVLEWLESGATASHGSVTEPCNHLQKFPHPQVLLLHYLQGSTAIEAYWKSVLWPQQSLFVGEPLAAPFVVQASRTAPPPTQFTAPRLLP